MNKAKFQAILAKFKLDNHHRMERFGVMFLSLVLLLGLFTGISFKKHYDNSQVTLGAMAKYTTSCTWSKTGQTMSVVDVYRNDDYTKAFILLQMDSTVVKKISTDSSEYQMFMTSRDGITTKPTGSIYIFGNTGYMGLMFTDNSGFHPDLYNVIVRNYKRLTSDVADEVYDDESFNKYNQIQIYANFAGSNAVVADFLNKDDPELTDIYADVISFSEEQPVREQLNETLIAMNDQMSLINEYGRRLTSLGIKVPALPKPIANDYVTDDVSLTANNPSGFDEDMIDMSDAVINSGYNLSVDTSDENKGGYVNSNKLYLVTDFVFPGGYMYNYQDMKLTDHYLDTLTGDLTFKQFVARKSDEKSMTSTVDNMYGVSNYYTKWEKTDGSELDFSGIELAGDTELKNAISDYTSAVSTLYGLKESYQTDYLYQLMKIEADAESTTAIFSVNSDADVLAIY